MCLDPRQRSLFQERRLNGGIPVRQNARANLGRRCRRCRCCRRRRDQANALATAKSRDTGQTPQKHRCVPSFRLQIPFKKIDKHDWTLRSEKHSGCVCNYNDAMQSDVNQQPLEQSKVRRLPCLLSPTLRCPTLHASVSTLE